MKALLSQSVRTVKASTNVMGLEAVGMWADQPRVGEASRTSFTVAGASQDRQKRKTGAGRFVYIP
jgi:hypothetical protein